MWKKHSRRLLILSGNWKIPLRLLFPEAEVTRSLSNVIKAYSIRYEEETKKTIDTHLRIDKELEERRKALMAAASPPDPEEGFVEGIPALVVDQLPSETDKEKAAKVLEDAKAEAERIINQAKKDAQAMKNEAYVTAQKKGFEDGMLQAAKETQKLKADYEEKARSLKEEYDRMAYSMEPQIADIIAALVEKITGIVIEDREEVILYLVDKTLKNLEKCDEYTVRVSKEDFEFVSMRKNLLLAAIGREVPLYIVEDMNLKKNQCLVETEYKVINCSLDVQLNNLIQDLKLIAGI
jgi:flagellar assembly protein FliH